jgi:hypothetical protein
MKILCTYSRPVEVNGIGFNPNEEKWVPDTFQIPEDWKSHLQIVQAPEKKEEPKVEKIEKKETSATEVVQKRPKGRYNQWQ